MEELKEELDDLKEENENLKDENEDYEQSIEKWESDCEKEIDENKKLKEKRQKLNAFYQKEIEENENLTEQLRQMEQFHEWDKVAAIKLNDSIEEIKKLKDFQILQNKEIGELTNTLHLSDTFLQQYITNKLEDDEDGQITIERYAEILVSPQFAKHIDTILEKMTTYDYGCYENGYWYNHEDEKFVLQHNGDGTISISNVDGEDVD